MGRATGGRRRGRARQRGPRGAAAGGRPTARARRTAAAGRCRPAAGGAGTPPRRPPGAARPRAAAGPGRGPPGDSRPARAGGAAGPPAPARGCRGEGGGRSPTRRSRRGCRPRARPSRALQGGPGGTRVAPRRLAAPAAIGPSVHRGAGRRERCASIVAGGERPRRDAARISPGIGCSPAGSRHRKRPPPRGTPDAIAQIPEILTGTG